MFHHRLAATLFAALLPITVHALGVQAIIDGRVVVFQDVPQSAWFAASVRTAAEAGIVNGYKDERGELTGMYGPSNDITLAEALKIAVEGAGYDEERFALQVASGVDHWSSAYVSVAKAERFAVINERSRLDIPATRAQVAALFTSAFGVRTDIELGARYRDVNASTTYAHSIEALSKDGIVSGDTDIEGRATGTFRPTERINRAEVAKMIVAARASYGTPGEGRAPDAQQGNTQSEGNIVAYTAAGFSPAVLRVKKGDTVEFRNDGTVGLWVASDPHPVHTDRSSFDALRTYSQGESYLYTFTQIGTFGYHNHVSASHRGTIIVE